MKKLAFNQSIQIPKTSCGGVILNRTWSRLFVAAALSLGCFGLTKWWYVSTEKKFQEDGNQKPIAYVNNTKDEISRRPVTRLLWQLVSDGDPIFPGEAIRTSALGEARIQFADSERYIDIEPDSLIVINLSENEISLDLMDGSFQVNQGNQTSAPTGPTLTLNSSNGKVDLSQATASLSKSTQGIDLQVLKGKAKIESHGQTRDIESGKSGGLGAQGLSFNQEDLQIISPASGKPFYINPEAVQPVVFQWKGFPTKAQISLQLGSSRKELKLKGDNLDGKFSLDLSPGKYFWKLVAKDKSSQKIIGESGLYRLEIIPRLAPSATAPEDKSVFSRVESQMKVSFHWVRPDQAKLVTVDVWSDPGLKSQVLSKTLVKEDMYEGQFPDGDYYWRVSASYEGLDKQINGKIQMFQIRPFEKPKPPVLIGWQLPEETTPQFFVDQPMASLGWKSDQKDQVKIWRLKLASTEEELFSDKAKLFETTDFQAKTPVPKPGRYIAMVEALDEKKQVLAKSTVKGFEVAPLPLIDAPIFEPSTGSLQADNQGRLNLQWSPITGAKEYVLTLMDKDGKELRAAKFVKNSTALVNLLPGNYKVSVLAIDQYGRKSLTEPSRSVVVPDSSGMVAPKLKGIKVK
jgi:hypothetical protein